MDMKWIKDTIKLNAIHDQLADGVWENLCKECNLTDRELEYTLLGLIGAFGDKVISNNKKIVELDCLVRQLESNNKSVEKIKTVNTLISGEKIAYKSEACVEKILLLKESGQSLEAIAETLGVSRSTVWRRLGGCSKIQCNKK